MKKTLMYLLALTVGTVATLVAQTIVPGGNVSGTWPQSTSPYLVTGDITIPDDSTLSIAPGVRVEFQGHYALYIRGRLLAIGTGTDTIVFTVGDTTGFSDPNTTLGGWYGIRMFEPDSSNDSTIIAYCRLSHGKAIGPNWPFNHGGALSIVGFDKVRISNCLIINNLAGGPEYPTGGGIGFSSADILIVDNTIAYNKAMFGGGADGQTAGARLKGNLFISNNAQDGAGLALAWSDVSLDQNLFMNNHSASGGGAIGTTMTKCRLQKNVFSGNAAPHGGGALNIWNESEVTMNGDTIRDNHSQNGPGGGILIHSGTIAMTGVVLNGNTAKSDAGLHAFYADVSADNCLFEGNQATDVCGAFGYYCDTLGPRQHYDIRVSDSRFLGNSAGSSGGAVRFTQTMADTSLADVVFDRCEFRGNSSNTAASLSFNGNFQGIIVSNSLFWKNSAALRTAGLSFAGDAKGTVFNCLFEGNQAGGGGGSSLGAGLSMGVRSEIDVINCTFANNAAASASALSVRNGARGVVTNSVFWGNSSTYIAVAAAGTEGAHLALNYCNLQYGKDSIIISDSLSSLTWGPGNIDANPLFVDVPKGDYHLAGGSPCIGAAIDSIERGGVWYRAPVTDIDGLPRPRPAGTRPDMGAYEEQLTSPTDVIEQRHPGFPEVFALRQNYPNPFNPSTTIEYELPAQSHITLAVYNMLGQEVAVLVNEVQTAGYKSVEFNGSGLPSGVYIYRLTAGEFVAANKFVLLK